MSCKTGEQYLAKATAEIEHNCDDCLASANRNMLQYAVAMCGGSAYYLYIRKDLTTTTVVRVLFGLAWTGLAVGTAMAVRNERDCIYKRSVDLQQARAKATRM
jgi:hypothetical protein